MGRTPLRAPVLRYEALVRVFVFAALMNPGDAAAAPGDITTVAGGNGFAGDGGPATLARLYGPEGVCVGPSGDIYIADTWNNRIRKVDSSGTISTVAGNGERGFGGDGDQAPEASLNRPEGVFVDGEGTIYIADTGNSQVRSVDPSGEITVVAGSGRAGFSGDGGPATEADLSRPTSLYADPGRSLYISDSRNHRVRKVNLGTGSIITVAGNGFHEFSGDGGPATRAGLHTPQGIYLGSDGSLYIADMNNHRVRKVDPSGTISTVAGNGLSARDNGSRPVVGLSDGDGGPATGASLHTPEGIWIDGSGALFIAERGNNQIRKVDPSGIISTVAGNGQPGFAGDGGPATDATLGYGDCTLSLDGSGSIYISSRHNHRIRKVDSTSGIISTVAGGSIGDGGPALEAFIVGSYGVYADTSGDLFIATVGGNRIRKVDAETGIITTVAGNGQRGHTGDGEPATDAQLWGPRRVWGDLAGNLYVTGDGPNAIRKVDAATGIISTVVGGGEDEGDGVPATEAALGSCRGLVVDTDGSILFADTYNTNRIRKVDGKTGLVTTVAGNGQKGFSGDSGPATEATLHHPEAIALDGSGNLYIADSNNDRVRLVDPSGIITTLAGGGNIRRIRAGGVSPTDLALTKPRGLALDGHGNLYIGTDSRMVYRLDVEKGLISAVAGGGAGDGDGLQATDVRLSHTEGLFVDSQGDLYIADSGLIRRVEDVASTRAHAADTIPNWPFQVGMGSIGVAVLICGIPLFRRRQLLGGVLLSPRRTLEGISDQPDWVGPLCLVLASSLLVSRAAVGQFISQSAGNAPWLAMAIMPVLTVGLHLVVGFLGWVICASVIWLLARISGERVRYYALLSVVGYARLPMVLLGGMLMACLMGFGVAKLTDPYQQSITSLGGLLPGLASGSVPLLALLGEVEVLAIWTLIVLVMGVRAAYRIPASKAAGITTVYWLLAVGATVGFYTLLQAIQRIAGA